MRRTNQRHTRAIQRHRRNQGPELFSRVADNELQKKADKLVQSLSDATINTGSVEAATLLIEMAESADWAGNPAIYERALSLAEKWSKEPPFVAVEIVPTNSGLARPVKSLQLTDGSGGDGDAADEDADSAAETDTVIDAEIVEDSTPPSAPRV